MNFRSFWWLKRFPQFLTPQCVFIFPIQSGFGEKKKKKQEQRQELPHIFRRHHEEPGKLASDIEIKFPPPHRIHTALGVLVFFFYFFTALICVTVQFPLLPPTSTFPEIATNSRIPGLSELLFSLVSSPELPCSIYLLPYEVLKTFRRMDFRWTR